MFYSIVAGLFLLIQQAGPSGTPVIEEGREEEIQALFEDVGKGDLAGWSVKNIYIPFDRIRATFVSEPDREVILEFRYPVGDKTAIATTPSFEVFLLEFKEIDPNQTSAFYRTLTQSVSRRDNGTFWRARAGTPDSGSPDDGGFWRSWGDTPESGFFSKLAEVGGRWFSTVGAIVTVAWLAAIIGFLVLVLVVIVRRRPWKHSEAQRAMIEMAILAVVAFVIREFLVAHGPGQQVTYLVNPAVPPWDFPLFGPGYGGWMLGWFALLGSDDSVAFLVGALAGALTVIPVYLVAWMGGGKRMWGLAAGIAIALWPVHARLSPVDDPCGLIALLVMSSLALVIAAERNGSAAVLIGGWLAGALAATVRPEPSLSLLALGGLVLWMPALRRLQMRIPVLVITIAILTVTGAAVLAEVSQAMSGGFSPLESLSIESLSKLLGKGGGSILFPPRTNIMLGLLFLTGLGFALYATKGKAAMWLFVGLFPAVPTACVAASDIISARYQMALLPAGAVFAGIGAVWLGTFLTSRLKRYRLYILPAAAAIAVVITAWPLLSPPPQPTFRLEYDFFRKHIEKVPRGCNIVCISWWHIDLGLRTPVHLSHLRGLGHTWIEPSANLDPDAGCLAYWQPASCRAVPSHRETSEPKIMPDCKMIETSYRLEPITTTFLPARTERFDYYTVDPVPVGFYRLRPLAEDQADSRR